MCWRVSGRSTLIAELSEPADVLNLAGVLLLLLVSSAEPLSSVTAPVWPIGWDRDGL